MDHRGEGPNTWATAEPPVELVSTATGRPALRLLETAIIRPRPAEGDRRPAEAATQGPPTAQEVDAGRTTGLVPAQVRPTALLTSAVHDTGVETLGAHIHDHTHDKVAKKYGTHNHHHCHLDDAQADVMINGHTHARAHSRLPWEQVDPA